MAREPRIRVIGSLNIDFVTRTPRVPGPGETLSATSMTVHAGGKGSNQAVACGRAAFVSKTQSDVRVDMIGAVGARDPYYASLLKPTLEGSGVSTAGVEEIDGVQTGTATIIVDEGSQGQNRILFVPGANHRVTDVESLVQRITQEDSPSVVVMQGEIPRATVLHLLHAFNRPSCAACVVFNPAPVFPDGFPLAALQDLAVLVVNETECLLLFRVVAELQHIDLPQREDDLTEPELSRLAGHLHDRARIGIVVVTLGARGVFYSRGGSEDAKPPAQGSVPSAKVVEVVDTTAAGDTFVGYFATALARHLAVEKTLGGFAVVDAVGRANEAAAKCVQRIGAMESIPFGYEIR